MSRFFCSESKNLNCRILNIEKYFSGICETTIILLTKICVDFWFFKMRCRSINSNKWLKPYFRSKGEGRGDANLLWSEPPLKCSSSRPLKKLFSSYEEEIVPLLGTVPICSTNVCIVLLFPKIVKGCSCTLSLYS